MVNRWCFLVILHIQFQLFHESLTYFQAQLRAGKKPVVIPKRPASTLLSEAMVPDVADPNTVSAYGGYVTCSHFTLIHTLINNSVFVP